MTTSAHKTTALVMALEDVYSTDETGSFYRAQPNKKLSARKISWAQILERPSHSCSCCKHDMRRQVET